MLKSLDLDFFLDFFPSSVNKRSNWADFLHNNDFLCIQIQWYLGLFWDKMQICMCVCERELKTLTSSDHWPIKCPQIELLRICAHTPIEMRPAFLCQTCLTPYTMYASLTPAFCSAKGRIPEFHKFVWITLLLSISLSLPPPPHLLSVCLDSNLFFSLVSISLLSCLFFLIAGLNNICLVTFHGELPLALSPLTFLSSPPDFVVKLNIVMENLISS